jgi:predicted benzoate:H+ symporter BenE
VRTKGDVTSDRLFGVFLLAAVVVVLVGWFTALAYLGFRIF